MRLRPAAVVCLVSLASVDGCERPRPAVVAEASPRATARPDTAHPATPVADPVYVGPAPLDTLQVADLVAVATAPIDTLMTLGTWLRAHPRDVVSDDAPPDFGRETHLCRKASAFLQVGAWRLTRSAVFNLPQPPPGEMLPPDTTRLAEQQCHLRAIWIDVDENDPRRAHVIADSLEHTVSAALGTSRAGYAIMARRVADGSGKTWSGRAGTVVLGIAPQDSNDANPREEEGSPSPPDTGRVLLVAYAPHSGLDPFDHRIEDIDDDREYDAEHELTWARADSALGWAGMPRIDRDVRLVLALMRATYAKEGADRHTPAVDSALVRLATTVRDSVAALPSPRRAAALFAADVALAEAAGTIDDVDTLSNSFRLGKRLKALGVPFDNDPLGAVHAYSHPWLWDAYNLDSLGRAGRAASTMLLSLGWGTHTECADEGQPYDRVIKHGEAALRRGETDPLVHYYVALAYHDIVALSQGHIPSEYADAKEFLPIAPSARTRAIEHFRAVLAAPGVDRRLRRHSWRTAMALMLGRSRPTRYFCVYD